MSKSIWIFSASMLLFSSPLSALAQHKGISFQAVLQDPEGRYPTASGLTVTLQILDPVNNCVLREEEHSGVNVSNGYMNLVVGGSSPTISLPGNSNPSPILSMPQVMDNSKTISGFNCTYSPQSHHGRKLRLSVNIPRGTGGTEKVTADFNMRAVAYAVNSETLNGKSQSDFVNVNNTKNVTQENIESIFDRFTKLDGILNASNNAGNTLGVNITGHAATATIAAQVSGVVPVSKGGTGATSASDARDSLGLGALATLSPTGTADSSTYLRGDGTWATVSGPGSETDPTVQNFAKNSPSTGLSVNGSNQLVVSYGTTAGTAVQGNDSRVTGAFQSATSLNGGDLSGTLPSPTVARINGIHVSTAVAGDDQKFLKYVDGSGWLPHYIKLSELKNSTGTGSVFNLVGCTQSQTMAWSSLTDQFSCQDISIPATGVTGLASVATSGDYNSLSNKPTLGGLASLNTVNPSLITGLTANRLVGVNGSGVMESVTCVQGQLLGFDSNGVYGCYNPNDYSIFSLGGNSVGGTAVLGTKSNHSLSFITNNTEKMILQNDGKLGIGKTPSYLLDINGAANAAELRIGGQVIGEGLQDSLRTVASIGDSCPTIGVMAKSSDGDLLVCDEATSAIAGASCSTIGVGAMTFDSTGGLYVCGNE